jgi:hypothetical protein
VAKKPPARRVAKAPVKRQISAKLASAKASKAADGWPKLRWDEYQWTAEIALPAWKGYQSRLGPYNAANSSKKSRGQARLQVLTENEAQVEPTKAQWRAWRYLIENQEAIRDAMLPKILKEYKRFVLEMTSWLSDPGIPELARKQLPKPISGAQELPKLMGLSSVYIHPSAKAGVAYVGFGFGCEWEEEHGLGVITHRLRVLEVGHEEVAFMGGDAMEKELRAQRKRQGFKAPEKLDFKEFNRAVIEGNLPWVKALLAAGASPEKRYLGPGTATAIDQAVLHDRAAILKLLLKYSKRPLRRELMRIAEYRKLTAVTRIIAAHGLKDS